MNMDVLIDIRDRQRWKFSNYDIREWLVEDGSRKELVEDIIRRLDLRVIVLGRSHLRGDESDEELRIEGFSHAWIPQSENNTGLIVYYHNSIAVQNITCDKFSMVYFIKLVIEEPFRVDLVSIYAPRGYKSCFAVQRVMNAFLQNTFVHQVPVILIGGMNIAPGQERCAQNIPGLDIPRDGNRSVTLLFDHFATNYDTALLPTDENDEIRLDKLDHIITNVHNIRQRPPVVLERSHEEEIDPIISDRNLIWCNFARKNVNEKSHPNYSYKFKYCQGKFWATKYTKDGTSCGDSYLSSCPTIIELCKKTNKAARVKCDAKNCKSFFEYYDDKSEHEKTSHFPCLDCFEVCKDKYYGPQHVELAHMTFMCRILECYDLRFKSEKARYDHEHDNNHLLCKQCPKSEQRPYNSKDALAKHKKKHRKNDPRNWRQSYYCNA